MAEATTITEADILTEVVGHDDPTLRAEAARSLLDLRFSERATLRMRELLDRNNKGTITATEAAELEKYQRVGLLLDLLQAKARVDQHGGRREPALRDLFDSSGSCYLHGRLITTRQPKSEM